jgi:hypothetical protein
LKLFALSGPVALSATRLGELVIFAWDCSTELRACLGSARKTYTRLRCQE